MREQGTALFLRDGIHEQEKLWMVLILAIGAIWLELQSWPNMIPPSTNAQTKQRGRQREKKYKSLPQNDKCAELSD